MMPEIDGLEACKYIKSKECYRDIPIIIATAKTDSETLIKSFEARASDYIKKPITNVTELLVRVKNALILKEKIDLVKKLNISLNEKIEKIEEFSNLLEAMLDLNKESIAIIERGRSVKLSNRSFRKAFSKQEYNKQIVEWY